MRLSNPFLELAKQARLGDEGAVLRLRLELTRALHRLIRCALTIPALNTRFAHRMRLQAKSLVARSDMRFSAEDTALVLARIQCERLIATLNLPNTQTRTFEDTWCELFHSREG